MPSSDPSALRTVLRAGTRDLHDRTEAAFVLAAPDVTRADYTAVLARLLGLYTATEDALDAWAPPLAGYGLALGPRRRASLLRRDLQALGCSLVATTPRIHAPTIAHAFGTLYVFEGATLGGQLLRRRLGSALDLTPSAGLAFFSAYGDDVGPMWRAFGDALDRYDAALAPAHRDAAHADALAGARGAFLAFERWVVAPTARRAPAALA